MVESQMQSYQFEGKGIRFLLDDDGSVSIVATDLAKILEHRDAEHMTRNLSADEKGTQKVGTLGGPQNVTVVTEAGMYKLILQREAAYIKDPDRRAAVERFQRWVTHEVLPSIRRHGAYLTPEAMGKVIADPDFGIQLLTALKDEQEKRVTAEKQVRELEPKAKLADDLTNSGRYISLKDAADLLFGREGINLGRKRLIDFMLANHMLMYESGHLCPTQYAHRNQWVKAFDYKDGFYVTKDGTKKQFPPKPMVSGKGLKHLYKKLAEQTANNNDGKEDK